MTKAFCDWCDNPCTAEAGLYKFELTKVKIELNQDAGIAKAELCGTCVEKIAALRDSLKGIV